MKQRLTGILLGMVFLAGLGFFLYPTLAEVWNQINASRAIAQIRSSLREIPPEDYSGLWEDAERYNKTIRQNTFYSDIFLKTEDDRDESPYWNLLDIQGTGVMGYLHIPKIKQELPIYHGTSESVLQVAIGHLPGTSLPIGGESTHTVLAAHRGLPSARLFTDVDQLVEKDKLYIHVLDRTFAYEVDQILPMVDKNDLDALTEAMQIVPGEDHVTLLTCTPYGVNSHRLLVRGIRVPYYGEDEPVDEPPAESMVRKLDLTVVWCVQLGAVVLLIILPLIERILLPKRRKKRKKTRLDRGESSGGPPQSM